MKIALEIDDNSRVNNVSTIYNPESLTDGWVELECDPYFNLSNYSNWSIKNGQLVKSDTGLTPMDENQQAITALTQLTIQQQQAITQSTELIGQQQQAITELTQTVASQAVADNKEDK